MAYVEHKVLFDPNKHEHPAMQFGHPDYQWCKACELEVAIERVRELHKPVKSLFGFMICETCLKDFPTEFPSTYSVVPYPCPTIKALDGEQ